MSYNDQAFSYVASQAANIQHVAAALGVSVTAIAGAMAEEHDALSTTRDFIHNPAIHRAMDAYAIAKLDSHESVMRGFAQVHNSGRANSNNISDVEKVLSPMLIDAGFANIKISTAVRLMLDYESNHLAHGNDPLGLSSYSGHYDQLVRDLASGTSGVTAAMTGLMILEAKNFFATHADPTFWAAQSDDFKDEVYVTYFNLGPARIQGNYERAFADSVPYQPQPGEGDAGGETVRDNLPTIRAVLADPTQRLLDVPLWGADDLLAAAAVALGLPLSVLETLVNGSLWAFEKVAELISTPAYGNEADLNPEIARLFATANALSPNAPAAPRRDPLSFDLDGDGIETIGIDTANPILFDHGGSGVRAATGWLLADDAFLALDRNGNGSIDSGRELFGDSTLLPDGSEAIDGFAALAAEDTNADGRVDAQDAHFASLRLWRDLDQDGISDAGELQTLTEAGIASIAVAKTENAVPLANGNQIADLGTYTRIDGSTGGIGDTATLADVDLASNPFFSEFTDHIALTPQAQRLPNMQGSGMVRNLREAASLQTAAGQHLASVLTAYAAATTKAGQMALLPDLVEAWAATSTLGVRAGQMGTCLGDVGGRSRTARAANDAQWIGCVWGVAA